MAHSVKKPSGTVVEVDLATGREYQADTLKCGHCQHTWIHRHGSGIVRGFCTSCMRPVCGPTCAGKCVCWEQQIENIEAGRPEDYKPIRSAGGFELNAQGILI